MIIPHGTQPVPSCCSQRAATAAAAARAAAAAAAARAAAARRALLLADGLNSADHCMRIKEKPLATIMFMFLQLAAEATASASTGPPTHAGAPLQRPFRPSGWPDADQAPPGAVAVVSSSVHDKIEKNVEMRTEISPALVLTDSQRVAYLAHIYGPGSAPSNASLEGFQTVIVSALVTAGVGRESAHVWCGGPSTCPHQDGALLAVFSFNIPCHMRIFDRFDSLVMADQMAADKQLVKLGIDPWGGKTQGPKRPWTNESLAAIKRASLDAHSFVEVTRLKDNWLNGAQGGGTWFYAARGSGVFMNLGRTMAFDEHSDAFKLLLPDEPFDIFAIIARGRPLADYMIYARLFTKAAAMGIDTIQFTRLCNMGPCGCAIEIVDTRGHGHRACATLPMRSGWNASKPCACKDSLDYANCGNRQNMRCRNFGCRAGLELATSRATWAQVARYAFGVCLTMVWLTYMYMTIRTVFDRVARRLAPKLVGTAQAVAGEVSPH